MRFLLLGLLVFGVNLLPAFGPPTWSLLVYARLRWHFDPVGLVIVGASCAALGRLVLGYAFRTLRLRFPDRYRQNLEELQHRLVRHRGRALTLATLFIVSPLPSAQLFCAAGLLNLRIAVLTLGFFAGRLVTYSLYVTTAVVVENQLGPILTNAWGSPWMISLQVLLLCGLVVLPLRPWGSSSRSASH